MSSYDVIIIGAGSVGLPTALYLAKEKLKVLALDFYPSVGQGQNKCAIGGVRATHSDPAKIQTCMMSLEIFSNWREEYGDDIGFERGGYTFPAYTQTDAANLQNLLKRQKAYGLNINWLDATELRQVLPGIDPEGLLGGTYSPEDAHLSPIKAAAAFYHQAKRLGVKFRCGEKVVAITRKGDRVSGVETTQGAYSAPVVVNAAGAQAREIGQMVGIELPVFPDCHEAGVTEPVTHFLDPLVVDIRKFQRSKNLYFYQNLEGHFLFSITPDPPIEGPDRRVCSTFLPEAGQRLIRLFPKLQNIKVRRIWRGLYPMTPDGIPIVDEIGQAKGFWVAAGMCGQGFMLGPGLALNLANLILKGAPLLPEAVFKDFSFYRDYSGFSEALR
ncbi:MAG: NAD(P)/FAD-dependent oxidoreductase [bacterium]